MGLAGAFTTFFIIWWLVLFTILPLNITSHKEAGQKIDPGTVSSAPFKPGMARKFMLTTAVAAVVWAVVFVVIEYNLVGLDDVPFLSQFG